MQKVQGYQYYGNDDYLGVKQYPQNRQSTEEFSTDSAESYPYNENFQGQSMIGVANAANSNNNNYPFQGLQQDDVTKYLNLDNKLEEPEMQNFEEGHFPQQDLKSQAFHIKQEEPAFNFLPNQYVYSANQDSGQNDQSQAFIFPAPVSGITQGSLNKPTSRLSLEQKQLEKTKRIQKREKAKSRFNSKKNGPSISNLVLNEISEVSSSHNGEQTSSQLAQELSAKKISDSKNSSDSEKNSEKSKVKEEAPSSPVSEASTQLMANLASLDPKQKKKMQQMIRNRISAQNSRDKKKELMNRLQQENQQLKEVIEAMQKEKVTMQGDQQNLKSQLALLNDKCKNTKRFICNYCGRSDFRYCEDFFADPEEPNVHNKERSGITKNYAGLGLALFTIFTMVCLLQNGQESSKPSGSLNLLQTTKLALENEVQIQALTKPLENQLSELMVPETTEAQEDISLNKANNKNWQEETKNLENILQLAKSSIPTELVKKEFFEAPILSKKEEEKKMIEGEDIPSTFLMKVVPPEVPISNCNSTDCKALAPHSMHPAVQTIYCPLPYQLVKGYQQDMMANEPQLFCRENDFIQLIMSKSQLKTYGADWDQILIKHPEISQDPQVLYEIWARVHSIREIQPNQQ